MISILWLYCISRCVSLCIPLCGPMCIPVILGCPTLYPTPDLVCVPPSIRWGNHSIALYPPPYPLYIHAEIVVSWLARPLALSDTSVSLPGQFRNKMASLQIFMAPLMVALKRGGLEFAFYGADMYCRGSGHVHMVVYIYTHTQWQISLHYMLQHWTDRAYGIARKKIALNIDRKLSVMRKSFYALVLKW
jgi:hypothetical protein